MSNFPRQKFDPSQPIGYVRAVKRDSDNWVTCLAWVEWRVAIYRTHFPMREL